MYTLDTEDDSQGNVFIINFFDGVQHETFTGKNLRYHAWDFLHEIEPATIWAVNAEYDLVNLFGAEWLGKLCTLQYVSSGLMRASYREAKITFLDTLRHWPAGVEDMGKAIDLPKLSMPHLGCDCEDCIKYCQRDAEITWIFVDEMIRRYGDLGLTTIRATLPSMALQLFKKFYKSPLPELPSVIKKFCRLAYFGGRVEVFKFGKIFGPVNHYDINSLFPSVMRDFDFPNPSTWHETAHPDFSKEGVFQGWVYVPSAIYPCLPCRSHEILFPYGNLFGTWCYPEIRKLLEDGGRVAKCKQAVEFEETERPFVEYVDFCYKKRLEATNQLDKTHFKLLLNSLYGKFGSHHGLIIIYDDKEKDVGTDSKISNVIWSAYTTCYARLKLLDYLRQSEIFYTDTDSLFTCNNLEVSNELGKLKLEGIYKEVEFKGNKIYALDSTYRAKGVPRKLASDFFRTGRAVYRKPTRFRESRISGDKPANVWFETEKNLRTEYTKRKILKDGSTEAWKIDDYLKFMINDNGKI